MNNVGVFTAFILFAMLLFVMADVSALKTAQKELRDTPMILKSHKDAIVSLRKHVRGLEKARVVNE